VARANGARLLPTGRPGGPLNCLCGDWFEALTPLAAAPAPATTTQTSYHVIVSNPPYIRADDPHLAQGDLRFEPRGALTDEADGLDAIRTIVARAPEFLVEQGWLWIEHGYDQSDAVAALLSARGFNAVRSVCDLAGIPRVSGGRFNFLKSAII